MGDALKEIQARMTRTGDALDIMRAVGELERAAQLAVSREDITTVRTHADALARLVWGRASLEQRVNAVRATLARK